MVTIAGLLIRLAGLFLFPSSRFHRAGQSSLLPLPMLCIDSSSVAILTSSRGTFQRGHLVARGRGYRCQLGSDCLHLPHRQVTPTFDHPSHNEQRSRLGRPHRSHVHRRLDRLQCLPICKKTAAVLLQTTPISLKEQLDKAIRSVEFHLENVFLIFVAERPRLWRASSSARTSTFGRMLPESTWEVFTSESAPTPRSSRGKLIDFPNAIC